MLLLGDRILYYEFTEPGYLMIVNWVILGVEHMPLVSCDELMECAMVSTCCAVPFFCLES
jgi:hypothetical protein